AGSLTITGGDLTVTTLTLTQGNLTTGSFNAIISSGGTLSRPGGTPGHVIGNLQKSLIDNTSVTVNFEVGTNAGYTPVSLALTGISNVVGTAGTRFITVSSHDGDHPNLLTSGIDTGKSVNRYFNVTKANVGSFAFTAAPTFTFLNPGDLDAGANTANFIVKQFTSPSTWATPTIGTRTSTTTSASAISFTNANTGLFDFAIGEADTTPPTVTNVTSSAADGTYGQTAVIPIQVVFSEAVLVTGTPQLTLSTGSPATTPANYASGSGTNTLTFNYTVGNNNVSSDLAYPLTTSLG